MTTARTVRLLGPLAVLAATGCVDRKFVIESNVPNAQVYIDNKSIGAAPAYMAFEYYGYYTIRVVHPGYEPIVERVHAVAPWYAYPPFDFLAEVIWPFHIHDTKRKYFQLHEKSQSRTDDILNAADALRQRGLALPQPDRPAEAPARAPKPPAVAPGSVIGPPVAPVPGPQPGPTVPGPQVPGPQVPFSGGPAPAPGAGPGVVPSVQPGYTPPRSTYAQ